MALSCNKKCASITERNSIKSKWRLLLFKLFSLVQNKRKLKKHEKVCNDHDYCYTEMPNEDNKILKYYYGENSLKVSAYYLS